MLIEWANAWFIWVFFFILSEICEKDWIFIWHSCYQIWGFSEVPYAAMSSDRIMVSIHYSICLLLGSFCQNTCERLLYTRRTQVIWGFLDLLFSVLYVCLIKWKGIFNFASLVKYSSSFTLSYFSGYVDEIMVCGVPFLRRVGLAWWFGST